MSIIYINYIYIYIIPCIIHLIGGYLEPHFGLTAIAGARGAFLAGHRDGSLEAATQSRQVLVIRPGKNMNSYNML